MGAQSVSAILPKKDGTVLIKTNQGDYQCKKLVVAAGHGSIRLLRSLGEKLHIYPQRGQLMVTQRHRRVLTVPTLIVRQTPDGTFVIGLSTEDTALDTRVTPEVMKHQAGECHPPFSHAGKAELGPCLERHSGHDTRRRPHLQQDSGTRQRHRDRPSQRGIPRAAGGQRRCPVDTGYPRGRTDLSIQQWKVRCLNPMRPLSRRRSK